MKLEKAIVTALDYEVRIRDLYRNLIGHHPKQRGP